MSSKNQSKTNQASRWLNVPLRVYTLVNLVNILLKRSRQGTRSTQTAQEKGQTPDMRQRLNELSSETRQWVAGQVQQLNEQARQLQAQSRQLRKALLREARQRRKFVKRMRKSGVNLSWGLPRRRKTVTDKLVERSGKVTRDLARRGEDLLKPVRKRGRNFWPVVGFVAGLVLAGFVTYRLVRRRVAQQQADQGEHIELPQSETWRGMRRRAAGRHLEQEGATVATLQAVDVENTDRPADAVFIGVLSTKQYHPIDTPLELEDIIYFASAEEAQARGFTAAQ